MKPYFKVLYNEFRYWWIKALKCNHFEKEGLLLLNYNTKISICRNSTLTIGDRVVSDGRLSILIDEKAKVHIGSRTYFNEACMISSKSGVYIGEGCQFGPNVKIFDNNHQYTKDDGVLFSHTACPISIGDHCWIGANAVILKGTVIGNNCVIGAGCVICGKIPDGSLVTQGRDLTIRAIKG